MYAARSYIPQMRVTAAAEISIIDRARDAYGRRSYLTRIAFRVNQKANASETHIRSYR